MAFDELVRRFVGGDPDALVEIDEEFGPRIREILRRQFAGLLRPLEIDDVLQEAELRAWRDCEQFDGACGSLPAWFFGIARHAGQELANSDWARQRQRESESDFKQTISPQRAGDQVADVDEAEGPPLAVDDPQHRGPGHEEGARGVDKARASAAATRDSVNVQKLDSQGLDGILHYLIETDS